MRNASLVLFLLLWAASAFSQDIEIYVSDAGNFSNPPWQILKFNENGKNPEVFISEGLAWPQDIVFLEAENTVLISNLSSSRINRHDADTGEFIDTFTTNITQPTRMKIGPDGLLYVLQWAGTGTVKRFNLDGSFVDDFTSIGVPQSIGLDWDSDGNLYVSSFNQASVRKFGTQGEDLGLFVNANLQGPTNIWFDEKGDLFVTDWRGGAVRRFDADGNFLGNFITGLIQPEGVDFLPNGDILIGDGGTGSVKQYDEGGDFRRNLVKPGAGGLIQPNAVVLREIKAAGFKINAGLNDAWFNPATDGQGFFIIVFPVTEQMFVGWFTFDVQRPAEDTATLGESGHRWLIGFGPYQEDTAELSLLVSKGGVFDAAEPPAVTDPDGIGTMTIVFSDCSEATATYDMPTLNLSGEIPIQRIASDNVALCESLAAE